jgi:hypothetical protein
MQLFYRVHAELLPRAVFYPLIRVVRISTVVHKKVDERTMTALSGLEQRRSTSAVCRSDIRSLLDGHLDGIFSSIFCCPENGRAVGLADIALMMVWVQNSVQ